MLVKKTSKYGPSQVGEEAGWLCPDGYRRLRFAGREHAAHRIAWFFVHGEMPSMSVDHINGDRSDNRIANLRLATPLQQQWNSRRRMPGYKGAFYHKLMRRWMAYISVQGKRQYLGWFDTDVEAARAYDHAAALHFGEFAALNFKDAT